MNDGKKNSAVTATKSFEFTRRENSAFVHTVVKIVVALNLSVFTPTKWCGTKEDWLPIFFNLVSRWRFVNCPTN